MNTVILHEQIPVRFRQRAPLSLDIPWGKQQFPRHQKNHKYPHGIPSSKYGDRNADDPDSQRRNNDNISREGAREPSNTGSWPQMR